MRKIILLLLIISLCSIAYAFSPNSDIEMWGIYGMRNAVTVNSTYFCDNNNNCGNLTQFLPSATAGFYLNITGGTMTGNINMSGNELTDVGKIIMTGLIKSYDIVPVTTGLYSLGNSTHWFDNAYITNLYSESIQTDKLNASEVNSSVMNSDDINVDNVLSLGGNNLTKDGDGNMRISLG